MNSTKAHRTAFPDWHATTDDVVVDGEKVVTRFSENGTHNGKGKHNSCIRWRIEF